MYLRRHVFSDRKSSREPGIKCIAKQQGINVFSWKEYGDIMDAVIIKYSDIRHRAAQRPSISRRAAVLLPLKTPQGRLTRFAFLLSPFPVWVLSRKSRPSQVTGPLNIFTFVFKCACDKPGIPGTPAARVANLDLVAQGGRVVPHRARTQQARNWRAVEQYRPYFFHIQDLFLY